MTDTLDWRNVAEAIALRDKLLELQSTNRLARYRPYSYQERFHYARDIEGNRAMQRLLMAGNRVGKTFCGGNETAMHATGEYPADWDGLRFDYIPLIWAGGQNNDKVRDINQAELLGDPHDEEALGTGAIPKDRIIKTVRKPGIPDALEAVLVRHKSGRKVTISFKSYDAGKQDWMGKSVGFIWLDEEPPHEIYTQALARTVDSGGGIIMTFTPENGGTAVVNQFMNDLKPGQALIQAEWGDAPHLTPEAKAQIEAALPENERDMRMRGIPSFGSGLVFPIADEVFACPPFKIPEHFARINGLDFGWDHPTAVAFLAWDRENDKIYLYDVHSASKTLPAVHAQAIKARGEAIPVAWPRDGLQADKGSGVSLADQYRKLGVAMLFSHFTNPPTVDPKTGEEKAGDEAVEPGIMEMLSRMQSGRFLVFENCHQFFTEKRSYHRKDGKLVKLNDDVISAARYGVQSRRFARTLSRPVLVTNYGEDYDPLSSQGG